MELGLKLLGALLVCLRVTPTVRSLKHLELLPLRLQVPRTRRGILEAGDLTSIITQVLWKTLDSSVDAASPQAYPP